MAFKRWLYQGGHPRNLAKIINRGWAIIHSLGFFPNQMVTLVVAGRKSGKKISLPLGMVVMDGDRYLVSMLGAKSNWVRNVKAGGGHATLRHGITEQVILEEIEVGRRAPILKAYLRLARGARPHFPLDEESPLEEFVKIAKDYPVFRVEPG